MSVPPPSANRQIARAAGTVMLAMVFSQLVGLLAKMLMAGAFDTPAREAFFAANRFSEILFNLVAGGALGSAFIPTFTGLLQEKERAAAWRLASAVANLVLLVLTLAAGLSMVFAPQVVRYILAPGFAVTDPAKEALTVELLRIQMPAALVFGLSGLAMGVLNAHQSFLLPSLAPAMYQLGWVFGTLALGPSMGVHGLAWGTLLGAGLHLLVQLPGLLRLPQRAYFPGLGLGDAHVAEVARLMGPRLLGVAVVQINFLFNTFLASLQPEGSLNGISLAFPLMIMPQAAIAQSIAIAALPTFSAQAARGRLEEMRASLAAVLRGTLLLSVPASLGLMLLRRPLVALIYQRQAFDAAAAEMVAWALLWYAAGLVGHSILEVVTRAFYALHDTKTPVLVGAGAMSLNLGFSFLFSYLFGRAGWMPHGGLALANSLATALEVSLLLVIMRRRLGGLGGRQVWSAAGISALGSLAMGALLLGWMAFSAGRSSLWIIAGGVPLGVLAYLGVLLGVGVPELKALLRRR